MRSITARISAEAGGRARARRRRSSSLAAAPAFAHATLLSESPVAGQRRCATSPKQLELTFDENVEISFGSIELFNQKGDRVDIGRAAPLGDHATTRSKRACPHLADGAYVLTWRVISADSHPVHGAYTFTVGNSSVNAEGLAAKLEAKGGGNKTVGVLFAIARAAEFAGIALLIGAVAFAAAIRPHGRRRSRADALVWVGWILLVVATIAGAAPPGPVRGRARRCRRSFHTAVVRAVLHTRYGHLIEIRLVLLLAVLPLLLVLRRSWHPDRVVVGARGAARHRDRGDARARRATPRRERSPSSRSRSTRCTSLAMSIWLGGLAALALHRDRSRSRRPAGRPTTSRRSR